MSFTIVSLATGKFVSWPDQSHTHNQLAYILYLKGLKDISRKVIDPVPSEHIGWFSLKDELNKDELELISKTLKSISFIEYKDMWVDYMDEGVIKIDWEFFCKYLPSLAMRYKKGIKFI